MVLAFIPAVRCFPILLALSACTGTIDDPSSGPVDPRIPPTEAQVPGREFVCGDDTRPGPNLVRRLTRAEYLESVRDVTGVDLSELADQLPAEPPTEGFSNTAGTLVVGLDHVVAYESLAQAAVAGISDLPAFVDRWTSCKELRCEGEFVERFGARAYRGPVLPEEQATLLPLFAFAREEGGDFDAGAALVIEVALQSPRFIYRMESEVGDGNVRPLAGHELAARLSYLVVGAPPDDELIAAASDGLSPAEVETQVGRLLEDPRADALLRTFASDWLRLDKLLVLTRDEERFPGWTTAIGRALQEETLDFVTDLLLAQERPIRDLFNAQHTVIDPILAEHYGINAPDEDGQVDLSAVPERGGLLTQGAIATIGGNDSSMVMRGRFMLDTILCLEIASPPPGIDTTPPTVEPGRSQRDYSEMRVENPACTGCHSQMEPPAFGLERFDAIGQYRLEDEVGNELREDGVIRFGSTEPAAPYDNFGEMMDALAESDRVRDCVSLQVGRYAMGRELLASDGCALESMRERFASGNESYRELLVAIANSSMFSEIQTEVAP